VLGFFVFPDAYVAYSFEIWGSSSSAGEIAATPGRRRSLGWLEGGRWVLAVDLAVDDHD
jgi:hypothetical protein